MSGPGLPHIAEESLWDQLPPAKLYREFKKFLNTRKAFLNGEPLHLLNKHELEERKLLGPWKFNLAQSLLSSLPGTVISVWAWLTGATTLLQISFDPGDALSRTADQVIKVLTATLAPLTLFVAATIIARASLRPLNSSLEARRAARRVYLYSDGAHGFLAQTFFSLVLTLPMLAVLTYSTSPTLAQLILSSMSILFWAASIWQTVITFSAVKGDLFGFDEELSRGQMFHGEGQQVSKYILAVTFAVPSSVLLLLGVFYAVAFGIAVLVNLIRPAS
jgi:hypothetical protein